jgi:hypothetical protein
MIIRAKEPGGRELYKFRAHGAGRESSQRDNWKFAIAPCCGTDDFNGSTIHSSFQPLRSWLISSCSSATFSSTERWKKI